MGISIEHQSTVFLYSILMGVILSLLYDIFRVLRKEIGHKNIAVMIEDILFWALCTSLMFVFVYNINSGQIRAFVFVGAAIGCILYYLTISRFLINFLCIIIDVLRKIITAIFKIILKPFIIIVVRPFHKIGGFAMQKSKKHYRNFKNIFKFKLKTVIISYRRRNVKKTLARNQKNK